MVAADFFTNFVWFLKIKVWGLFIFDSFFNQRVNPKDFKSCSKTQNPNFDSSMGSCIKCFFMMIYVIIDGFKKGNSMNPCLCKFPKVGL